MERFQDELRFVEGRGRCRKQPHETFMKLKGCACAKSGRFKKRKEQNGDVKASNIRVLALESLLFSKVIYISIFAIIKCRVGREKGGMPRIRKRVHVNDEKEKKTKHLRNMYRRGE
ncbi:hypothetical protein RB195_019366 [Necator americanus]|uniref:Uncharacterized protein n=1 Tax=Necator americanus TaxID=51031 RepID=A0ABR1CFJ9_NECAM